MNGILFVLTGKEVMTVQPQPLSELGFHIGIEVLALFLRICIRAYCAIYRQTVMYEVPFVVVV